MVESPQAARSEAPVDSGSGGTPRRQVASSCPCLSSLSSCPYWRYDLRQEPYAGKPLVRVRAGSRQDKPEVRGRKEVLKLASGTQSVRHMRKGKSDRINA